MSKDEKLFSHLFDVSPFPAVLTRRRDHTILAINRRTAEIFQIPQDRAIGRRATDYYADSAQREELATRLKRDGLADNFRVQIKRQNGGASGRCCPPDSLRGTASRPCLRCSSTSASRSRPNTRSRPANSGWPRRAMRSPGSPRVTPTQRPASTSGCATSWRCGRDTLQVERLSMWRFDDAARTIECAGMYQRTAGRYESGSVLSRDDAPAYFEALERERVIAAHDARTDPRTSEFLETYLTPTTSAPCWMCRSARTTRPSACCAPSTSAAPRTWTVDEQNFAVSTANLIAVAVADEERRQALARLAESEARARLIVDTAHDAFVGIDSDRAHRDLECAGREHVRVDARRSRWAGAWPRRLSRRASARRTSTGMQRFHETGEAPIVNQRLELTGCIARGVSFRSKSRSPRRCIWRAAISSAPFSAISPIGASTTISCAEPRSRRRRRRGPRASSSRT